jgi:WD40 repeat protein
VVLTISPLTFCGAEVPVSPDYSTVEPILAKHCLDCHAAQDPEAELVMENFETLMKGGKAGPSIVPGKSAESLLVQMIEGNVEREGKKKIMPPGKRKKLEVQEIAAIKAWIDAGAKGPKGSEVARKEIVVPKITPKVQPRNPINAVAYAAGPKLLAVARYGAVELRSMETRAVVRTLSGHHGNVNAVAFSADGAQVFAAAGEPSLFGEVRQWKVSDGSLVRTLEGHHDAIYALALSPDGTILATGSYDQKIRLWKVETGQEIKTLSGHHGCVFDLAFRPDGKLLASASADRTIKLWDVASGERRDTLSQPLKEQYCLAFSLDGKRLCAGGADNRIRVWQISAAATETTNPILESKFAHEGAVLNLALSPDGKTLLSSADDRTVKLWDVSGELKEKLLLEKQPDWPPALTFASDGKVAVVGRLDGSLGFYDLAAGTPVAAPKPELQRAEPRGLQRGAEHRLQLIGANLASLTELKLHHEKLKGALVKEGAKDDEVWITVTAPSDLALGPYEISVVNTAGESGRVKIHVEDLPQMSEVEPSKPQRLERLPVSFWGAFAAAGDTDEIQFDAPGGQTLVLDVASKRLGSKAGVHLSLLDASGREVVSTSGEGGSGEPLVAYPIASGGRYTVRLHEPLLGGSQDHFYRLSVGALPVVTGFFPLSARVGIETEVELIGYNLPAARTVKVKPEKPGDFDVPIDESQGRTRRALKLLASELSEMVEVEPNNEPGRAMKISTPGSVNGRIRRTGAHPSAEEPGRAVSKAPLSSGRGRAGVALGTPRPTTAASNEAGAGQGSDVDLFAFDAKAGQTWIIETAAAQRGSPMDTKIEVLHADGQPVPRVVLQAVRNSAVTFRGIDSGASDVRVENWEEMESNQLLYMNGEVLKLFRAPQGPDSGFAFYTRNGGRRCYFDTSPVAHPLDEPCYIVEPHAPGEKLVATGLPVFPLYFANDDDGERKLGTDSKLYFTAPAEGTYLIRVTDTRGFSGERFVYRLVVREPKPDFVVSLSGANPTVSPGSGQSFTVSVERIDGFEDEVAVEITGLPPGFTVSTPLVIQAGHNSAAGTINAMTDAPQPNETNAVASRVTATATIHGRTVTKEVTNFGKIKLGDKPRLYVGLEPDAPTQPQTPPPPPSASGLHEITIAPGQTVPAWLKVRRNGHDDLITFSVENLPHGVIVDNIGLNGVLIPKGENERQLFLTAAKWVPETDRLCFAIESQAGRQTSLPVMLHVRKGGLAQASVP